MFQVHFHIVEREQQHDIFRQRKLEKEVKERKNVHCASDPCSSGHYQWCIIHSQMNAH